MGLIPPLLLLLLLLCSRALASASVESYLATSRLRRLSVEFFDHYQNITLDDLGQDLLRLPTAEDLKCLADLTLLTNDLKDPKIWALKSKSK